MLNRNISFAAFVCIVASVPAFGQGNQGTANVLQLPGQNSPGTAITGFGYNSSTFSPSINAQGPAGAYLVIPKPDGTKFYIVSSSSLQVADSTYSNIHAVAGVAGTPLAAAITPNGKFLIVGIANSLTVVDTSNDQVVGSNITVPSTVVSIVASRDSARAYVLTGNNAGSQVTALNLSNLTVNQNQILSLASLPVSITLSPLNLLYATSANRIFEIDPSTLTVTANGEILLPNFTPGALQFTPDGATAYAVNTDHSATASYSLLELNVANHTAGSPWPPYVIGIPPPALDSVLVASASRVFAFSKQTGLLYDVNPGPPVTAIQSALSGVPVTNVVGVAISNEIPSARFLYELVLSGTQDILYRVDLSTNQQSLAVTSPVTGGVLQFAAVPPESGAVSPFVKSNATQTLAPGATSAPLIARVLDSTGRPVYNQLVSFTSDGSANGLTFNPSSASATTNADGYVQTTVTAPTTGGNYTVTFTAGSVVDTFTIRVTGGGLGGGGGNSGGGGGSSQVSIVGGDGQLVFVGQQSKVPLTVKVFDTSGKPLANSPVTFAIDSGAISSLSNSSTVTDANGLASTFFTGGGVPINESFHIGFISATAGSLGSVEFTETSLITHFLNTGTIGPGVSWQPGAGSVITVQAGVPLQNAITGHIYSQDQPQLNAPIPGVSIVILDPSDPNNTALSPVASCQSDLVSDQTGTVNCNLVAAAASCQLGLTNVNVSFGYFRSYPAIIDVEKGGPSALKILAGDGQSGQAGLLLPTTLTALVSDGCGNTVAGAKVRWSVPQSSATLSSLVTTSDSGGHVSAQVTLGQTPGDVPVKLELLGPDGTTAITQVTFHVKNSIAATTLNVLSGNNQTAQTNQNFAQPLSVILRDSSNNPISGITVTFAVTSGSASIGQASAITNATGVASVTVGAGPVPGPIVITATYSTFSVTFNLTAQAAGGGGGGGGSPLTPASFVSAAYNAASTAGAGLVPCGLATVTGSGLVPIPGVTTSPNPFGLFPYTLNGVVITVGTSPAFQAPIQATANINGVQSVTFQVPCDAPVGTATVNVSVNGLVTSVPGVTIAQAMPGIYNSTASNGKQYATIIGADGNAVTPSNPAHRGQTYYAVVTGLGQVVPPTSTDSVGVAGLAGQSVIVPVVVGIADAGVPGVIWSQYVPGLTGIYIVSFQIAPDTPTGEQHFAIAAIVNGQFVFGNQTFIAVN